VKKAEIDTLESRMEEGGAKSPAEKLKKIPLFKGNKDKMMQIGEIER